MARRLQKLLFKRPQFHDGINVTVRDGSKWMKQLGREVLVCDAETEEAIDHAEIIGVLDTHIGEVPDGILKLEHDKDCTNVRGIWREMERVYGKTFSFWDKVTVVFFRFIKNESTD